MTDDKAVVYLRQFKPRPQANLRQVYRTGSDDALRLISSMLQFNPYFRPTVDELLSDNYFSDVRQFSQAYDSPSEIVFDFENTQMSIQKTRELFIDEIQYYKALRCSGLSEVSPARIKNGNVRIFFNPENSARAKAKKTTPDATNNLSSNSTAAESVK